MNYFKNKIIIIVFLPYSNLFDDFWKREKYWISNDSGTSSMLAIASARGEARLYMVVGGAGASKTEEKNTFLSQF